MPILQLEHAASSLNRVFFEESDWDRPTQELGANSGATLVKTYNTGDEEGLARSCAQRFAGSFEPLHARIALLLTESVALAETGRRDYGEPQLPLNHGLDKRAFRVMVTDLYGRRCAIHP